jgi:type IX secretion system PorP/SprF family membrane protein
MKTLKILIVRIAMVLMIIMSTLFAKGQQDPMYTQYIFNLQTVNPAYVGFWQTMGVTALSRNQWVGLNGHPTTQTFSFQTPLRSQNVGLGLNVVMDKVGYEKRFTVNADYSYEVMFSDVTSLRFGLKGGFTNYNHNLNDYVQYPDNLSDPLFQANIENKFMPNFGLGLFLSSSKYFLSLSLPAIIKNNFQSNVNNYSTQSEANHVFFAGGLLFDLSENVKFKPTFMTKAVTGSPIQYDLSANFLLAEKFWIGGMYRSGDAVGAIVQWIFKNKIRLGYAYDFTTTDLRNYQQGVHEVMISYEFVYAKHVIISPRYF